MGFKFSVYPVPVVWWWVLGVGFRVCTRTLWCEMKGFKVEGQHVGAAQTKTVAHPGECRHFGHATKLHSFKSHNTHEDPRFAGPLPVTVGTFETKVTTLMRISSVYHGGGDAMGGGGVPPRDARPYVYIYIYIYIYIVYMYVCSSVCMVYISLYMVIHALQVATSADTLTEF